MTLSKNLSKAKEILSYKISYEEIIELLPYQYPKGAIKKDSGEGWSLWKKDNENFAVVLGIGVFRVKDKISQLF